MITITLVGRLTKDAKLKYTDQGKPVANFTIACTRKRVDKDGNKQTSFVRCVLWGKPAEVLSKYCQKGALIGAQGELVTRHYDNQQGVTQYVTEVWLDSFEFLESKHARDQRETTLATKEDSQESHVPAEASKTTQTGSESLSDLESYNQPPIDGMTTYGAETTSLFDN